LTQINADFVRIDADFFRERHTRRSEICANQIEISVICVKENFPPYKPKFSSRQQENKQ
jgi:hypothetical protein